MARELDRRNPHLNNATPARQEALRALAGEARLPGDGRVSIAGFDAATGNPSGLRSADGRREQGNYVQRALEHVQQLSGARVLGLEAGQAPEYQPDPHVQTASSGAVAVHLQQLYKGIPIFQAGQAVRFTPDGRLQEALGSAVPIAQERSATPQIALQVAVQRAAAHVATPDADEYGAVDQFGEPLPVMPIDLSGFEPQVLASFANTPARLSTLAPGPFADPIKAQLIWFDLDGDLRLCWEVVLTLPNHSGQYRTLVDATTGAIQYCRQLIATIAARGNVYPRDGSGNRTMLDFPRQPGDYHIPIPGDLPNSFPEPWVAGSQTVGNCAYAHLGDSGPPSDGAPHNGVMAFDPADAYGDDQKVLNIFYLNCYMHDFFYMLGFREHDGNFQRDNFGRGGAASDRVDARAHSGAVWGTANMYTPADGSSPVMNMGLVTSTGRHTAFDSSVVFHEYMHGVTNRLVGGPQNVRALDGDQGLAMGEGWGDYIACTINDTTVVGAWVKNTPGGLRKYPYDSNFPDHFGMLGTGRYTEPHNNGEIWCAALMELNRQIGGALHDAQRGKHLGLQLVVDALKLSRANPSFLDMRDAIVSALEHMHTAGQLGAAEYTLVLRALWLAFATFGMGPRASSNGATLFGIVADMQPPADLPSPAPAGEIRAESQPGLAIPDNDPAGVADTITIAQAGALSQISVAVDIAHTYIGDLQLTLVTPNGARATLHDRAGGSTHDLVRSYTSANSPALAALAGAPTQGEWQLHVADLEAQDAGTLRSWSIAMHLAAAPIEQPGAFDDFTRIRGIAATMERRLHAAGIQTYAQLAAHTLPDLVAKLGLNGALARSAERNRWIEQARELASAAEPAEPAPNEAGAAIERQHYATFIVELLLGEESEVRRTRVKHVQEGEQGVWAGWEDGRLVSFFVEHAALRPAELKLPGELEIDVGEIDVMAIDEPGGRNTHLHAELGFRLAGLGARAAAKAGSNYLVHMLAYLIASGETVVLAAAQGQLAPGHLSYTHAVEFAPPSAGHYQLLGAVVLSEHEIAGAAVGPKLRVVP
ncbi:MAG: M36 family metallopeptidase [Kouleothrix sp.]|jgi:extracellular elastinolytic metalloproteinase|nr:M36 family metallopeptidase [Kouleothrix sp.]